MENKKSKLKILAKVISAVAIILALAILVTGKAYIPTNLTSLSKEEQETVHKENIKNMEQTLASGGTYVIVEDLGVYSPVYSITEDTSEYSLMDILDKGSASYSEYGSPGEGNFTALAHNSGLYSQGYFTPFVNGLNVGDIVTVRQGSNTYEYQITNKETVNSNQADKLKFESDKPVITLMTCDIPSRWTTHRIIWNGELITKNGKAVETNDAEDSEAGSETVSEA